MRWPWQKTEKRSSNSYTDARIAATLAGIEDSADSVHKTATLEAAAGLYAACLAGAHVTPSIPALTPACLSLLARDLIKNGESLFLIRVSGERIELLPVASWDIRGGISPETWFYQVDLFPPTSGGPTSQIVPAAGVVHCRYSFSAGEPWRGIGPMTWAASTGALAGSLESRLSGEAGGPSGYILPVPQDGGAGDDSDPLKSLKSDLATAKGKTSIMETTAAGWGEGRGSAPMQDWQSKRYGIDPPDGVGNLRSAASVSVLNACQVPAALFDAADGTSQREAWRRFAMGPLSGLARIIESELSEKLMQSVKFDFSGLWAHDLAGRAQAFNRLVAGGMGIEQAAAASGVLMND